MLWLTTYAIHHLSSSTHSNGSLKPTFTANLCLLNEAVPRQKSGSKFIF
jgi:hypothetical protein